MEPSNAWLACFRRLARDYEPLPGRLVGQHSLAFAIIILVRFITVMALICRSTC